MAALTWQQVAAPNFGDSNALMRQAGDTLNNAFAGIGDALAKYRAQNQAAQEGALLSRALQIQDPAKMREALASGSLLAGLNPATINPKVLGQLDSRVGSLLQQAATQQGIDSSKVSTAANQYKLDRTQSQDQLEDAARGQLAAQLGLTGDLAKLSTADQQKIAGTQSTLATQALGRAATNLGMQQTRQNMNQSATNFNNAQTDRANAQEAIITADNIMRNSATIEDARANLGDMTDQDPVVRAAVNKRLSDIFGNLYAPVDAPVKATGKAPAGSGATDAPASPQAAAALQEISRRASQNSSVGVIADIEKNLKDTRSAGEVATDMAKTLPGGDAQKITGMISEALSKNPNLSAADVGSALQRSVTNNFWGSTSVGDIGIDDATFKANLQSYNTGKADRGSAEVKRVLAKGQAIEKADKKLAEAKTELAALARRADSQPGIDLTRAMERVQKQQEALDAAIAAQQSDDAFKPIYQQAPTPEERRRPERGRANNQRP